MDINISACTWKRPLCSYPYPYPLQLIYNGHERSVIKPRRSRVKRVSYELSPYFIGRATAANNIYSINSRFWQRGEIYARSYRLVSMLTSWSPRINRLRIIINRAGKSSIPRSVSRAAHVPARPCPIASISILKISRSTETEIRRSDRDRRWMCPNAPRNESFAPRI